MKTAWEKIFHSATPESPLSEQENDQAIRELAEAVSHVEQLQSAPEHQRILAIIGQKLQRSDSPL